MVICVHAPDSAKDRKEDDKFMQGLTKVMLEGRRNGAKRFCVAGDLNIELGFLYMDDGKEMKDIYGPRCWY